MAVVTLAIAHLRLLEAELPRKNPIEHPRRKKPGKVQFLKRVL